MEMAIKTAPKDAEGYKMEKDDENDMESDGDAPENEDSQINLIPNPSNEKGSTT